MTTSTPGGRPPAASATAKRLYVLYRGREDRHAEAYSVNGTVKYRPVHLPLSIERLTEHVEGKRVLGMYVLTRDSECSVGVIDLDTSAAMRERLPDDQLPSLGVARRLFLEAVELGVPESAMLISFSGSKGHHLALFTASPVEGRAMRQLLHLILSRVELAKSLSVEVFPKQDRLDQAERGPDDPEKLGSLVKIPYAHHPKTGKVAVLVDPHPVRPMPAAVVAEILLGSGVAPEQQEPLWPHDVGEGPIYEGDGRHDFLMSVAGTLRGRGLSPDEILAALLALNREKCRPPKSEDEVRDIAGWIGRKEPGGEVVSGAPDGEEVPPAPVSPVTLPDEACGGLAWRMTRLISDYVESDEAAILWQFVVAFGTAAGLESSFFVGATEHRTRLYLGLVGATSRARKGSGWDAVEHLFRQADPRFGERIHSGIGSGEKLVHLVRDPDEYGPGARDRRLLVVEPELARLLVAMGRDGSTLSEYFREAFDGRPLRNDVKRDPASATVHQIGLIGHVTPGELRGKLSEADLRNGLANRILWATTRRARLLPDPPVFRGRDVDDAVTELREALQRARRPRRLVRTGAAQELWEPWYRALPDDDSGPLAAVTARAEAQVVRLSLAYALMEGADAVDAEHLRAAIALWGFAAECAGRVFGDLTGNVIADRILRELERGPVFKRDVWNGVFNRNISALQLETAVVLLEQRGLLRRAFVRTGNPGPMPERWSKP